MEARPKNVDRVTLCEKLLFSRQSRKSDTFHAKKLIAVIMFAEVEEKPYISTTEEISNKYSVEISRSVIIQIPRTPAGLFLHMISNT